jgi:hypothetical protein
MKIRILNGRSLVAAIAAGSLLLQSAGAYAWTWPSHYYDSRDYHHHTVSKVPHGYKTVLAGGLLYYFLDGLFYRQAAKGYVVVTPPRGAVISSLPPGYNVVMINGDTYYYHNGAYYRTCPSGYMVVSAPVVAAPQNVYIKTAANNSRSERTTLVNIPNSNGSYTPVVLQKSGNGYVGPQGEYYPDNPTVEQLQVLYGK